jgi:hypothetical protein
MAAISRSCSLQYFCNFIVLNFRSCWISGGSRPRVTMGAQLKAVFSMWSAPRLYHASDSSILGSSERDIFEYSGSSERDTFEYNGSSKRDTFQYNGSAERDIVQ